MASADRSSAFRSAEETLRAASLSGSPQYDDAFLDSPESPARPGRRTRSPVDDSNVSLGSGEYDDKTLDASQSPGPSGIAPSRRTPTPSPPRQSPEERWEARSEQVAATYEELRHSDDINRLVSEHLFIF